MITNLLLTGLGGFAGAISRYLVYLISDKFIQQHNFPLGTLLVNIAGSFLIGIVLGLSIKYGILTKGAFGHFLFVTGFLGAFTTFSTFSYDSFVLLTGKHYSMFFLNIIMNVVLGIGLAILGYYLIVRKLSIAV